MNYKNMRYVAGFLMSMACSVCGMQLKTKEGTIDVPQAVIDASPVLKEIQNKSDALNVCGKFQHHDKKIVELVISHQLRITSPSMLPSSPSNTSLADYPQCAQFAQEIKLSSLLIKYGQYLRSQKN